MVEPLIPTSPHSRPGPHSKVLHDKERIKLYFKQYWRQGYTYEEIAGLMKEHHNFSASLSAYKKFRNDWNLPRRYFSAAEKDAQLAELAACNQQPRSEQVTRRVCPLERLERRRRDRVRQTVAHRPKKVTTRDAHKSKLDESPVHDSDEFVEEVEHSVVPQVNGDAPERYILLPDVFQCLTQAVYYIREYARFCALPTASLASSGGSRLPNEIKLLPWTSYSKSYNAFEVLDHGKEPSAVKLLITANEHMAQALLNPNIRLLSNLLGICFMNVSDAAREYMRHTLVYFVRTARSTMGPEHPLSKILQTLASADTLSVYTKTQVAQQLVSVIGPLAKKDFDGVYEAKEMLVKLLISADDLGEATKQCQELLDLSIRFAGTHCDDTYRVRRLYGRLLEKKLPSAAEDQFRLLLQDSEVNEALFVESAARKEWIVWEDLATGCKSRNDISNAEAYTRSAFDFSVKRYGSYSANTIRILHNLNDLLIAQDRWEDLIALKSKYPQTYAGLKESPLL